MTTVPKSLDEITSTIIHAAIRIHKGIGPGVFESVYEMVLAQKLEAAGLRVKRQHHVDFEFDGIHFERCFCVDLLVEDTVVVEVKSVERLARVHSKQVLTYLRLMKLPLGLVVNFGGETLKEGLHRVVNNLSPSDSPALRVNQQ